VTQYSIGLDYWNSERPITRVEVSLGRKALKDFGVDSVSDLFKRERTIVDTVTQDWFRLLAKPKVVGMGKRAKIHPLWERVRELFFRYFTGDEIKELTHRQFNSLSCPPTSLWPQVVGCLAKAYVLQHGKPSSLDDVITYIESFCSVTKDKLFQRAVQIADELTISIGIPIGNGVGFSKTWQAETSSMSDLTSSEVVTGTVGHEKSSGVSGSTNKATVPRSRYAVPEPAYDEKGKYPEADDW